MSAETVLQNVLVEIGLDRTTPQLTASDYETRQIKEFMNATGKEVSRRAEWSRLFQDLTVPGSVDQITLPDDFHQLTERGAVRLNKVGFHPVRVVTAPEQWAFLTARPSAQPYCHLAGGKLLFASALDTDGALVRYVSKHWVTGKEEITENGDTLLIPERLVEKGTIWRWRRQKTLPYDDLLAEYEADILVEIDADRGRT